MITELRLKSPDNGQTFDKPVHKFHSAQVVSRLNEVGPGEFVLPIAYLDYVEYQGIIEVWRRPNLRSPIEPYLFANTVYLIDWWEPVSDTKQIKVKNKDAKILANWRIVANFAGSGNGASYSAVYGDDLIETILTNAETNALFPGDFSRSYATYLAIEAATSAGGVTLDKDFAWTKDVLNLFRAISDLSVEKGGERIFFDIIKEYGSGSKFLKAVTYAGKTGHDKTGADTSVQPVILSEANGNLTNVSLSYDYTQAAAIAYAAGQDAGTNRTVKYAENSELLTLTWMRETFKDARNSSSPNAVQDEANDTLRQARPRKKLAAKIVETPDAIFGYHFNIGDKVRVEYKLDYENLEGEPRQVNEVFDCWVEGVALSQSGSDARENLEILLESTVDL